MSVIATGIQSACRAVFCDPFDSPMCRVPMGIESLVIVDQSGAFAECELCPYVILATFPANSTFLKGKWDGPHGPEAL